MNKLLADIIKIKLEELLISIYSNYKKYIAKEDIIRDFKLICSRLTLKTRLTNNNLTKRKKRKKERKPYNIPLDQRCEGRSWGSITEENGKKIYGYRCRSKKIPSGKYCYIHNIKLTHGNFMEEPDKYLKYHFESEHKLIKKREAKKKKIEKKSKK